MLKVFRKNKEIVNIVFPFVSQVLSELDRSKGIPLPGHVANVVAARMMETDFDNFFIC